MCGKYRDYELPPHRIARTSHRHLRGPFRPPLSVAAVAFGVLSDSQIHESGIMARESEVNGEAAKDTNFTGGCDMKDSWFLLCSYSGSDQDPRTPLFRVAGAR